MSMEKMSYNVSAYYPTEIILKNHLKAPLRLSSGINHGRKRPCYETNDKESGVRKMYKKKKCSCGLCKLHKRGGANRWKEKEKAQLKRFARAVAAKKFDDV